MSDLWAVLYLHDWDDDGKVYPEIHAVYGTSKEADDVAAAMTLPEKYWVRRARIDPAHPIPWREIAELAERR